MKLFRKPSIKKSLSARTTGSWTRKAKRSINPFYGKKGMGLYTNPKKYFYNKGYSRATQSAFKRTKGRNVGFGVGGSLVFIILLLFVSCIGSIFGGSNDNTNKLTSEGITNIDNYEAAKDNSQTDYSNNYPSTESVETSAETITEIGEDEPEYYSDYKEEELAINRYVTNYINNENVCPLNEDDIVEYKEFIDAHKVLLSFGTRFENNIYMFMEGYYHTNHYFTLEIRGSGENDDELKIHLKDCIMVIYPNLIEDEINEIINKSKEAGENGYTYDSDLKIEYSYVQYVEDNRHYSYIITYK